MDQSQTIGAAEQTGSDADNGRWLVRSALAGFGLMFAAAGLLWVGFGPGVFYDSLNALTGCF